MKKLLILILLFLFSSTSYATNCVKHPIVCHIVKNSPRIDKKYAMKLSNIIHKSSKKWGGDSILAVAIATQETGLKNINRKQNIIRFYQQCEGEKCTERYEIIRGATDVCMFQFHVDTIVNYQIDPIKLKNNIRYCVDWHFKLMKNKIKICSKTEKPWGCYHSKNKTLRDIYVKLVERYLIK